MGWRALLPLVLVVCLGCENSGSHNDTGLSALRDSLNAYKDSLRAVQKAWTFNMIGPVVHMDEYELSLGDTCHARVHVTAANDWVNGYRFDKPRLMITGPRSTDESVVVTDEKYFWDIAFVPERIGEDSLSGTVKFSTPGTTDSVSLSFSTRFHVKPR
jgi:hypothetical protein